MKHKLRFCDTTFKRIFVIICTKYDVLIMNIKQDIRIQNIEVNKLDFDQKIDSHNIYLQHRHRSRVDTALFTIDLLILKVKPV